MRIQDNDGGGKSLILNDGENLRRIPRSHRRLVTPQLRKAFADPPLFFGRVAERCPFPSMARWLRSLISTGVWDLALHRGVPPVPEEWSAAGIRWWSDDVQSAEITPASRLIASELPPALQQYYSLVDEVSWMPFGCAGGLEGAADHTPLTHIPNMHSDTNIDPTRTFVFGSSPSGDQLIYTEDGRGGWLSHENGKIHPLGSIENTIDWVYAELLANRCPDFDGLP